MSKCLDKSHYLYEKRTLLIPYLLSLTVTNRIGFWLRTQESMRDFQTLFMTSSDSICDVMTKCSKKKKKKKKKKKQRRKKKKKAESLSKQIYKSDGTYTVLSLAFSLQCVHAVFCVAGIWQST